MAWECGPPSWPPGSGARALREDHPEALFSRAWEQSARDVGKAGLPRGRSPSVFASGLWTAPGRCACRRRPVPLRGQKCKVITANAKHMCKKKACLSRSPWNMCEDVSLTALHAVGVEVDPGQGSHRGERPVQRPVFMRHSLHKTDRSSFLWAVLIKSNHPIKITTKQDIQERSQKPSSAVK